MEEVKEFEECRSWWNEANSGRQLK